MSHGLDQHSSRNRPIWGNEGMKKNRQKDTGRERGPDGLGSAGESTAPRSAMCLAHSVDREEGYYRHGGGG